jgi:hypothetical protein
VSAVVFVERINNMGGLGSVGMELRNSKGRLLVSRVVLGMVASELSDLQPHGLQVSDATHEASGLLKARTPAAKRRHIMVSKKGAPPGENRIELNLQHFL